MRKIREKAKTLSRGSAAKSFGSQWLVVVTSASLISLFVVMPYTVGYFSYFDLAFLPFFSISDYYIFSAIPLAVAILLFAFQYAITHLSVRSAGRKALAYALPAFVAALAVWSIFYASIGITIVLAGFLVVVLLAYAGISKDWNSLALYVSIFVATQLLLFAWGHLNAFYRVASPEPRTMNIIASDMKAILEGRLLFSGSQGILLIGENNYATYVHLDGGVTVKGRQIMKDGIVGACWFGVECFQYVPPEDILTASGRSGKR
ncbi:MAG: hypothetical protein KF835_11335 [Xanthobacteraceae bacterium]|nr:hypothetical protein [Xanthobacteraceae bacterium]